MHDNGKLRFGPIRPFSAIYDWLNTCESIPNFDGVLISVIVFLLGCLLIGCMYIAGSLSTYRQEPAAKPSLAATPQLLEPADSQVRERFGRPRARAGPGTWGRHSPQELFGQASAASSAD